MVFSWPWSLLGLLGVGAVAVWALLRPGRQLAVVATLSLWRQAVASLDRSARRRSRRVTPSWVALLAGAAVAVLAAARPVYQPVAPVRQVAVALHASAELADEAAVDAFRRAADTLLRRLAPHDRVQLLLPAVLGTQGEWLPPGAARRQVAHLRPLPVAAADLAVLPPSEDAQHVYRIVPAGLNAAAGAKVTVIEVSSRPAPATIDALGAVPLADGGRIQVFVAVRGHARQEWRGRVKAVTVAGDGQVAAALLDQAVELDAGQRRTFVAEGTSAEAVRVDLLSGGRPLRGAATSAFLVRRSAVVRKVAMTGADEPLLRRYVRIDPTLELIAEAARADVVIANGQAPPAGKAALVIAPPAPPPGWRAGEALSDVSLGAADVTADHPVMRSVALEGVHVRRLRPWQRSELAAGKILASLGGQAVILSREPAGADLGRVPRRVYVAFELNVENTNFSMRQDFVVFLANVMRFLAPPGRAEVRFVCVCPRRAGMRALRELTSVAGASAEPFGSGRCPLVTPGLYRDEAGRLHAVSLLALRSAKARVPGEDAAAAAKLPAPLPARGRTELWPALLAAAALCWLAGWALRGL